MNKIISKQLGSALILSVLSFVIYAQTDVSLFMRKDSLQVPEIVSEEGNLYKLVGHHGPAIENAFMGLRIYFNHSGSIDVYSKQQPQLELAAAHWYPSEKMQAEQGFGCDEYKVGSTVGLGGINLWDGEKILNLTATQGRDAYVKKTPDGAVAEMLAKGVIYKGKPVDILIRITMKNDERTARVDAYCTKGKKVQFVTGVNFHPGKEAYSDQSHIAVWGRHPADVSKNPINIGGGMRFNAKDVAQKKVTDDAIMIVSKPSKHIWTTVVSAGEKEENLNNAEKFFEFVKTL